MEAGLSRGAVAAISASENGAHAVDPAAVLQVADLQVLGPPGLCPLRYRMVLSDGVHSVQGGLPTSMNHLVEDGDLRPGTVLRLLEYCGVTTRNMRFFMFFHFEILQTDCTLIEYGEGQGIEAGLVRKTVAEISAENLDCFDKQEHIIVNATLTFINKENFCYTACPLVVNGRQCRMEVSGNGDGWWHCHSCNQTFVTCDYRYRVLIQLQDSTGMTYATASQQAGEEIFGRTAKELYLMKCKPQDCAQFDNIVGGVLFRDFLFKLKLKIGAIHDKKFPKCTIVKAAMVNPSTESRRLLREINKLMESPNCTAVHRTSVGSRIGFSNMEARQKKQKFSCDHYAMNHGRKWDLVSRTGSNSL